MTTPAIPRDPSSKRPSPSSSSPSPLLSPSSFPSSEPVQVTAAFQYSTWYQMNHSHWPHDDRGDIDLSFPPGSKNHASHASHGPSSEQATANEGPDAQAIDPGLNTELSRLNEGNGVYNSWAWMNYLDDLPGVVNVQTWMQGSSSPPGPGVAVPWEPAPRKLRHVEKVIDVCGNFLSTPTPTTVEGNASCTSSASAPKQPPPSQVKRSYSNEDEDEQCDARKRKTAPPSTGQQTSSSQPIYPKVITQTIRPVVDEDFENSCEFCFFYLQEPFKYVNKPFTSCNKARAEISHIVTHAISDHGLIRGRNSERRSQRYLTRCASHNSDTKGKSNCEHCADVEHWTEEDLVSEKHEGEAVCLRCYAQLPTKRDLLAHLKDTSLCEYHEDRPMRQKTRVLYSVFCSPDVVPKFSPPAGPIRDGARKRNMKTGRRASQKPRGQKTAQGPPRAAIQPTQPPQFASQNSEFGGNFPGNYFSAAQHALVPRHPVPSYPGVGLPQELTDYAPPFHGLHLATPATRTETQSMLTSPSMQMSSQTETQPMLSSPSMSTNQAENQPVLSASVLSVYSMSTGWQIRGDPLGKHFGYGSTDSGFVSKGNEDNENPNPPFDENLSFPTSQDSYDSEYFNNAWLRDANG